MTRQNIQTDYEMLEFAMRQELKAYEFYIAMSKWVKSPRLKETFKGLAEVETEHKRRIELELMKLGRVVQSSEPRDEDDVNVADYIVGQPDSSMEFRDLLALGIEKEDASFRLYLNLLTNTQKSELREVLFALAEDELTHKIEFEEKLKRLEKQG